MDETKESPSLLEEEGDEVPPEMTAEEVVAMGRHPVFTTQQTFEDLKLPPSILNAVHHIGFKHPTPIQSKVIPLALEGRDLIGLAQTGSGKTAAFVIPMAERLEHHEGISKSPLGLILCPTREIALQTKAFLDLFGKHHDLNTACIIGGVKMNPQIRDLERGPDIVVATPGRLVDHMERRTISLSKVRELVLDEADHMLDMGFLPQIMRILEAVPRQRRTMMFSATMPPPIERLAQRYLIDPIRIDILPEGRAATGITHRIYLVKAEHKRECLLGLVHQELGSTLIFTRTKLDADWLCGVLDREGHPVSKIHSDRSQSERTQALQGFREGQHRILVATGIASRGLDVPAIEHVINFEIPDTVEEYIHRAGRTARAGAVGIVSTIAVWQDKPMIKEVEAALGKELPRCTVPGVPPYVELKVKKPFGRRRR
ncbi:MAG TPA: DEAD/DEAH box helicase [bacterium]|nr:DEAD/DEAH box helicase [bacterium]